MVNSPESPTRLGRGTREWVLLLMQRLEDSLGIDRDCIEAMAGRGLHRVGDGGRAGDDRRFADNARPERSVRRGNFDEDRLDVRNLREGRQGVVQERTGEQLTVVV